MNRTWLWLKMKLGLGPDILVVECARCGAKSWPSSRECGGCGAALPEERKVVKLEMPSRSTPDDFIEGWVEAFAKCPGCGRMLKSGARTCPECGTVITSEYAAESISTQVKIAQAYSLAGRVESFNPLAFLLVALSAGVVLLGLHPLYSALLPVASLWFLHQVRRWFRWFGSEQLDDEEFTAARRKVKGALRLWLATLAVQAVILTARLL
jgi:uncharacterized OB-fold protein